MACLGLQGRPTSPCSDILGKVKAPLIPVLELSAGEKPLWGQTHCYILKDTVEEPTAPWSYGAAVSGVGQGGTCEWSKQNQP